MNSYLDPVRRFPWLLALGVPVAFIAAMLVVYQVSWGSSGPTVGERHTPTYRATVQILVTSPANPYLRARESDESSALLDTANYLPFLIESDRVAAIRTKKVGRLPGEVTAQALFARVTNRGLNTSSVPIIEVNGFAPTPSGATRLAQGTVDATITWLTAEQQRAGVAPAGRVVIQRLRSPEVAEVSERNATGLAGLVFVVVLLGFVALAWVLDRARPPSGTPALAVSRGLGPGREPMLEPVRQNGPPIGEIASEPVAVHGSDSSTRPAEEAQVPSASERRWA